MNIKAIKNLYHSLDDFERNILQQQRKELEEKQNIRFTNMESYLLHLAEQIITRQHNGEFIPRTIEEARSGYYLH